jgi:S-adenosylmethionine:tRNA ribosyltransferase-isomerase
VDLDDFHYDLPPELIAQTPSPKRRDARLLVLGDPGGRIADRRITDVVELIEPGDLLVFNDTKVLAARLFGHKETGGRVELLIERVLPDGQALAHIKASKAPKSGTRIRVADCGDLVVTAREAGLYRLRVEGPGSIEDLMRDGGHIPLPPYITRADDALDAARYQTVYGRNAGAVAAPTAGLHFDEALMQAIIARGAAIEFVTLHVGAGTFQPVRVQRIEDHTMHRERFEVPDAVVAAIARTQSAGGRVIAIGTTSVRALESAAADGEPRAMAGETGIFIYPGYRFRVVDAMLTNFHLPGSTLLMLVSAFAGREPILRAYAHAIRERYRFFSYGDAMWLNRAAQIAAA